jgi:site-specific DNA-methyltransferase (adenine-specific)
MITEKKKAPRNRSISLSREEVSRYKKNLLKLKTPAAAADITGKIIHQDVFKVLKFLPDKFIDILFIDPPYNIYKKFNNNSFREIASDEYEEWIDLWLKELVRMVKDNGSVYFCGDWRSSSAIQNVLSKYFIIRNRITWEREKGRGAKSNWKNCSEDIWYCTKSDNFKFNIDAVKIKRKVLAPYKVNGEAKDWNNETGIRDTHPSNIWTDITVPFWSMPENTDHPTQKPEKLLAKIILASSDEGDMVFDPFLGSGTTAVTAKKLGRKYSGIEKEEIYCCYAEKRIELAEIDNSIQGYKDNIFWERNSL